MIMEDLGNGSVFSVLTRSAQRWADRAAIIDEHGVLDYRTLLTAVEKAAVLLKKHGLREGDGVGVQARNSRGFIIAAFAVIRCGATLMPISHVLTLSERNNVLESTPLHYVITDGFCGTSFGDEGRKLNISDCSELFLFETGRSRRKRIVDQINDAAFIRYTSGTTGKAKGVVLSQASVLERIVAANKGLQLTADDTVLFVLPMAFHFYVSIILYLYAGSAIVIARDLAPMSLVEMIDRHRVTFMYASPLHYRALAASRAVAEKLHTLKQAVSTSTGISSDVADEFYRAFRVRITQAYGIIEVGLPIINLNSNTEHPYAIGHPLPDYEAAILDDDGIRLSPGKVGHLAVRGPGMFSAYLDPHILRDDVLENGWFMTGDMAHQAADGMITIQGRKKSMINVCGEKVFPEEVEFVLNGHDQVEESFVYGISHPRLGEMVSAQVVPRREDSISSDELITYARSKLSPFKVPQRVLLVQKIDKTSSGKIYRMGEQ